MLLSKPDAPSKSDWREGKLCTIEGCVGGKYACRGLCNKHWYRMRRYGSLEKPPPSASRRGEKNGYWSGDAVTYSGAHIRVRRARGKPYGYPCHGCGEVAALQWAYDHADPNEKIGESAGRLAPFSPDPEHYLPMCGPCHYAVDHPPGERRRSDQTCDPVRGGRHGSEAA